ncbi:RsmB/NOP family class I SAM-dependent RNA methyltransferase [Pyrobaculum neutrophilum]|uniref:tRNA (cytosine(72)-C(5))-methyltransferase n=1 Tax=Pyrobaculum neutrophilum (strain DSM 2338 / JCM 9278 / NBRC 100436 / V24Sta) TaxID=444157 RepID=B1Y9P3_PYRNV|nr:RsmB/NOP family class I SAM-dependent RNA methyltransferase [Pyrobaculum neutrophilum]ACB38965.1 PUA domain containing protein [Pyrobaculum neutrophilum V24Sta]
MNIHGIEIDDELYKHFLQFLSDSEIDALFLSITRPPRRYYIRVNTAKTTREELIGRLRARGVTAYPDERFDDALWMPVEGPFKIPTARKRVVVDKKAAESVMMGADLYAPGVVKTDHVRRGEEVNVVSDNGVVVAFGVAVSDSDEVMKTRRGLYIRVETSLYKTPKIRDLPEYRDGLFYSQSLPAIAVGHVAKRAGAATAVDLNAAPGGKATHLAQMDMRVVAFDRSWPKIERLKREVERLGLAGNIDVILHDSRYVDRDFPRLRADLALVDPPCTDIGVRPKIYHRVTMEMAKTLSRYQLQFLKTALKIASNVIYSTCTLTYIENEDVVKKSGAVPADVGLDVGGPGWGCPECRRFLPHVHDTPGFFIALLSRR